MKWTDLPEFSNCPDGWEVAPLSGVAAFAAGQSPDSSLYNSQGEGLPFLQGNADFGRVYPIPMVFCTAPTKLCDVGDTLISVRAPVGALNRADQVYGLGRGVGAIHPTSIDADYLWHAMSRWSRPLLRAAQGSTFDAITARHFRQLRCCLPTAKHEQEALAERLTCADAAITAAEAKLTAAKRLKTALMQQLFMRGIPGRHTRFKAAKVFRHDFEVPDPWDVGPLRTSLLLVEYGTNAPSNDNKHGLPVVAIPEVVASRFQLGECSHVEISDEEADGLRLQLDDVLLIRTNGNADYIGKSTVIGDEAKERHIVFASYLIRIRTDKALLSGGYLNYFLASPLGRRLCLAMANTSAGNHNLGSRAIKQFVFPRPPTNEQAEIVGMIDAAEDSTEALQAEIIALHRLKRSLLQNLLTGKVRVKLPETT